MERTGATVAALGWRERGRLGNESLEREKGFEPSTLCLGSMLVEPISRISRLPLHPRFRPEPLQRMFEPLEESTLSSSPSWREFVPSGDDSPPSRRKQ